MANERLRSALLTKGYTATRLAAELGVDRKSVERWVAGRTPYRRYRYGAARRLGVEESYLWPGALDDSQVSEASASEVVQVYPHRATVPRQVWRRLFDTEHHDLAVLETRALLLADDPQWRSLLTGRDSARTRVRLLFDGDGPDEATRTDAPEPPLSLDSLRGLDGVEVRLHPAPSLTSVYRADDDLLVTCHIQGAPASQAPVLRLTRVAGGELVSTYLTCFERLWDEARPLR